jgi:16S rRNA (cytosine967-C5)-methyltransferase
MMRNEGTIIAVDKYEAKLSLIRTSCDRLGITNVKFEVADATHPEDTVLTDGMADRVLLDTPCSGLGVLTKKPDIKWKRDIADIHKLNQVQTKLIERGAKLLKPGGVLVYSTCTTEPEENQRIVMSFLERHPEFVVDDPGKYVNQSLVTPEGFVETFPHRHSMDGSFAARLVRTST